MQIPLERLDIQLFQLFAIAVILAHRIGLAVMLVQNVQIERIRPPLHDAGARGGHAAMHDRTFPRRFDVISVHLKIPFACSNGDVG